MAIKFAPSLHLIVQYCTFHTGVVKDVKDKYGKLRVKCECNGLLGKGEKNWTGWINTSTNPIGSSLGDGDEGLWWPIQKGQSVRIGFLAGDPFVLYAMVGPAITDDKKPLIPAEAKKLWEADLRKPTRIRLLKGESGHTLLMDDNGKQELCALLNWTGSGTAFYGPGKEEGDDEPRSGEKRGTKNVFSGTAKKPSEIVEGGIEYTSHCDLWGGGLFTMASDENGGALILGVRLKDGSLGPSLVLDGVNDAAYLSSSAKGATQLQVLGKAESVYVTCQMIWEAPFKAVKGLYEGIFKAMKGAFSTYES